jgi:hypothetical protein
MENLAQPCRGTTTGHTWSGEPILQKPHLPARLQLRGWDSNLQPRELLRDEILDVIFDDGAVRLAP